MANIELINLVTTELVQRKKLVEYNLRIESNRPDGTLEKVIELLREYRGLIGDIQLWETLVDEITPIPENIQEGDNNLNQKQN
jgi:hypothetical protein